MDLVNRLPKAGEAQAGDYSIVDHMVATALWEVSLLEEQDFDQIKISMKAFDVPTTVEAYRRLGEMVPYPLAPRHHGGQEPPSRAPSVPPWGLGVLLYEGDRGHDPRIAQRRQRGGGHRRLRDTEIAEPAGQGNDHGGLPQLRPGRRGTYASSPTTSTTC